MSQPGHPGVAGMMARWDGVDGGNRRLPWRGLLALAVVMLSAWVWVSAAGEGMRYRRMAGFYKGNFSLPVDELTRGLNGRDKFLLLGDLSKPEKSSQLRALWDSDPNNPSCFAVYADKYRVEHDEYPPDYLETARRLDPDNAWFTYRAAAKAANNSVRSDRQTSKARKAGEAPTWKILDEAKLNQALTMLRDAGHQKQFVMRQKRFVAERIPLLSQDDRISRMLAVYYLVDHGSLEYGLLHLADAVAAKAWLAGGAGDVEGFKGLLGDVDALIRAYAGMKDPTLVDALIIRTGFARMIRSLHAAAGKLALDGESRGLKRIVANLDRLADAKSNRQTSAETVWHGSVTDDSIERLGNLVESPPPLTDAELKPGRMTDHLLASRVASLAVWVLLGTGLLALAVFRFCLPAWMLRLAQRVNELLTAADWAWLFGGGVLLPFAYVTVLRHCTPLGGQDWSLLKGGAVVLVAGDYLALALLLLVVPSLVARWRFGKRAAALGICAGIPWFGWFAVATGMAFVPVLGMSAPIMLTECGLGDLEPNIVERILTWRLLLLVPLLLGILLGVGRALAVKFDQQLSRGVVVLSLLPVYAFGMFLLMASMPVYQAAQARYERHDPMTALASSGVTRYEGEIAREMMRETRQALEMIEDK